MSAAACPWSHVERAKTIMEAVEDQVGGQLSDACSDVLYAVFTLAELAQKSVAVSNEKRTEISLSEALQAVIEVHAVLVLVADMSGERNPSLWGTSVLIKLSQDCIELAQVELASA